MLDPPQTGMAKQTINIQQKEELPVPNRVFLKYIKQESKPKNR